MVPHDVAMLRLQVAAPIRCAFTLLRLLCGEFCTAQAFGIGARWTKLFSCAEKAASASAREDGDGVSVGH